MRLELRKLGGIFGENGLKMSLAMSVPSAAQVPEERHLLPYGFATGALRLVIEAKKSTAPSSLFLSLLSLLPLCILILVFLSEYYVYIFLYILPQIERSDHGFSLFSHFSYDTHKYVLQYTVFNVLSLLLLVAMFRTMFTRPGEVPATLNLEVEGEVKDGKVTVVISEMLMEMVDHVGQNEKKKSQMPRFCRTCFVLKPDRSHHCSVCNRCVLRMDHHCPYINNCVGQHNYKFFMLMLVYGVMETWLISLTMWEGLQASWMDGDSLVFQVVLGVVYFGNVMLMCVISSFFCFHIYMIANAVTTIELKEKMAGKVDKSPYFTTTYGNFQSVLGSNPLLWLVPVAADGSVQFKFSEAVV